MNKKRRQVFYLSAALCVALAFTMFAGVYAVLAWGEQIDNADCWEPPESDDPLNEDSEGDYVMPDWWLDICFPYCVDHLATPTPTPDFGGIATWTPYPTATPTPSGTVTITPTATPTATMTPTPTPVPTNTLETPLDIYENAPTSGDCGDGDFVQTITTEDQCFSFENYAFRSDGDYAYADINVRICPQDAGDQMIEYSFEGDGYDYRGGYWKDCTGVRSSQDTDSWYGNCSTGSLIPYEHPGNPLQSAYNEFKTVDHIEGLIFQQRASIGTWSGNYGDNEHWVSSKLRICVGDWQPEATPTPTPTPTPSPTVTPTITPTPTPMGFSGTVPYSCTLPWPSNTIETPWDVVDPSNPITGGCSVWVPGVSISPPTISNTLTIPKVEVCIEYVEWPLFCDIIPLWPCAWDWPALLALAVGMIIVRFLWDQWAG